MSKKRKRDGGKAADTPQPSNGEASSGDSARPESFSDDDKAMIAALMLADTEGGRKFREMIHGMLAGDVYRQQLASLSMRGGLKPALDKTGGAYAKDLVARLNPRDPLEEMLVEQCLWAHGRVRHLSALANQQTNVDASRQVNDSADKASNTFRRLMLALREYRQPPRSGDQFTAIKQANIANQQVVQNLETEKQNVTNEKGCAHDATTDSTIEPAEPAALPAESGGACLAASEHSAGEAVEAGDRPADTAGQGPVTDERVEAR